MAVISKIILLSTVCALGPSACGHKGKLSTPSEIEAEENGQADNQEMSEDDSGEEEVQVKNHWKCLDPLGAQNCVK